MTDSTDTGTTPRRGHDGVAQITRDELRARVEQGPPLVLLETLPVGYWRKAHLPGAGNLPPDQVRALAPSLVPDKRAEIVVYCWDFT